MLRTFIAAAIVLASSATLAAPPTVDLTSIREALSPKLTIENMTPIPIQGCCKRCSKGKPCGNSCIARSKSCHKGPGCAC